MVNFTSLTTQWHLAHVILIHLTLHTQSCSPSQPVRVLAYAHVGSHSSCNFVFIVLVLNQLKKHHISLEVQNRNLLFLIAWSFVTASLNLFFVFRPALFALATHVWEGWPVLSVLLGVYRRSIYLILQSANGFYSCKTQVKWPFSDYLLTAVTGESSKWTVNVVTLEMYLPLHQFKWCLIDLSVKIEGPSDSGSLFTGGTILKCLLWIAFF